MAYGIFPDQEWNSCPPQWQADSYPLYYHRSPVAFIFFGILYLMRLHSYLFIYFGLAPWLVGSWFPDQRLNPGPQHGVLTTGKYGVVKAWSPNHWTTREFPRRQYYFCCCCSVSKSCLIYCNPMDSCTPGSSVLHYLPELAQIYVH